MDIFPLHRLFKVENRVIEEHETILQVLLGHADFAADRDPVLLTVNGRHGYFPRLQKSAKAAIMRRPATRMPPPPPWNARMEFISDVLPG